LAGRSRGVFVVGAAFFGTIGVASTAGASAWSGASDRLSGSVRESHARRNASEKAARNRERFMCASRRTCLEKVLCVLSAGLD
jgi:hypothetical protein